MAPSNEIVPTCNFMDANNPVFWDSRGVFQMHYPNLCEAGDYPNLCEAGVGACVEHATIVSKGEEDLLWEAKVIGDNDPLALLRAMFYCVGKTFCIRGGEEQKRLKQSQFVQTFSLDCYTYTENGSNNRSGSTIRKQTKLYKFLLVQSQSCAVWFTCWTLNLANGLHKQ